MDPITTAIIAALAEGLTQDSVADSYNTFKQIIKTIFDNKNDVIIAIDRLEQKPHSKARQMELHEQFEENQLDKNTDVVKAAKKLLDEMKSSGNEKQANDKYVEPLYNKSLNIKKTKLGKDQIYLSTSFNIQMMNIPFLMNFISLSIFV